MEALIIVDIQNDFLPGGALAVPGGDEVVEIINRIQSDFPLVIATQDWHPPGHKSFASSHADREVMEVIEYRGISQVLWPDHCMQGTHGAAFSTELEADRIEAIFRKGTDPEIDSYSGFFDNGRQKSTGLTGYLRDKGVEKVWVCGLAADFCVYYTAMDALDQGYDAHIIENASRAIDPVGYAEKRSRFLDKGGEVEDR